VSAAGQVVYNADRWVDTAPIFLGQVTSALPVAVGLSGLPKAVGCGFGRVATGNNASRDHLFEPRRGRLSLRNVRAVQFFHLPDDEVLVCSCARGILVTGAPPITQGSGLSSRGGRPHRTYRTRGESKRRDADKSNTKCVAHESCLRRKKPPNHPVLQDGARTSICPVTARIEQVSFSPGFVQPPQVQRREGVISSRAAPPRAEWPICWNHCGRTLNRSGNGRDL